MIQAIVGLARRFMAAPAPLPRTKTAQLAKAGVHGPLDLEPRRGRPGCFAEVLDGGGSPGSPRAGELLGSPPRPATAPPPERTASALADLWPALVRRVAWEGDGQRASIHLELGAGALAGATLLLRCEGGRIHVSLSDPAGADLDAWRARIGARLLAAGIAVDAVE
jgi:hypothetical protein